MALLMMLQSDQKITEAAVGTTPKGFSTVWYTLGGVCDMVDQHTSLFGGMSNHDARMLEVNRLLGQVQLSLATAVWEASSASGVATNAMTTLAQFLTTPRRNGSTSDK